MSNDVNITPTYMRIIIDVRFQCKLLLSTESPCIVPLDDCIEDHLKDRLINMICAVLHLRMLCLLVPCKSDESPVSDVL